MSAVYAIQLYLLSFFLCGVVALLVSPKCLLPFTLDGLAFSFSCLACCSFDLELRILLWGLLELLLFWRATQSSTLLGRLFVQGGGLTFLVNF